MKSPFINRLIPGALALVSMLCHAQGDPSTVHMNQIQVIGTHNSYHAGIAPGDKQVWQMHHADLLPLLEYQHPSLTSQLSSGVRQLEIDVYGDKAGGRYADPAGPRMVKDAGLPADPPFDPTQQMRKPGFKVMHIQDVDYRSVCQPLRACLQEIRSWSSAHPRHVPLFILIEPKQNPLKSQWPLPTVVPEPFDRAAFDALDREILAVFPRDEIVTPDDVRGTAATLNDAVTQRGWPTLEQARGKVVFLLDPPKLAAVYRDGHPSLAGRVLFTNSTPGAADAAFVEVNTPDVAQIGQLVRAGYLIRTRSDDGTLEAMHNDTTRRDTALASGAQIISTDYPGAEPARTGFKVELPQGRPARCDLINAPPACRDSQIVEH
ncbi:phosphatidylinositol-specific phospholipase C1-like protein [Paraburkholderia jirisanensis]